MGRRKAQAGAALVLVLWLVAALSLVVLASAHGIRQQTQNVGLGLARMRAEAVLDAAIALAAQRLTADKRLAAQYRVEYLVLGTHRVRLEITPSGGLVDVNVASDALLEALLRGAGGVSPGEAATLVSRIHDYIDPDDVRSAIASRRLFNLLHYASGIKVDLIVRKSSEYRQTEFARRLKVVLAGVDTWIVSREDLILSKLVWAQDAASELQLRDVRQLLSGPVDIDYLYRWAPGLGVVGVLQQLMP